MAKNNNEQYLIAAQKTIQTEIEGLQALHDFIGDNFFKATDLILNNKGRVIVSGMGKSGHIANKIAATLASTGTPSFFVHPGEASHGDLGMISKEDIVILLSNSGETKELEDMIHYCKRFSIPIIGIVRRKASELSNAADIALILPEIPEASKVVKAPTTSTTMMLVLGDALAMALMEAKEFGGSDYGILHPGGKLGSEFIKVNKIMRQNAEIPLVKTNTYLPKIIFEMTSKHLGCTGVVDNKEKLIGVITDGDLRRHISRDFMRLNAQDLMTQNPITIEENMLAAQAVALMNKKGITSLFVVNNKKDENLTGILHLHDCLKFGVA